MQMKSNAKELLRASGEEMCEVGLVKADTGITCSAKMGASLGL
jgi:hypothetical protein